MRGTDMIFTSLDSFVVYLAFQRTGLRIQKMDFSNCGHSFLLDTENLSTGNPPPSPVSHRHYGAPAFFGSLKCGNAPDVDTGAQRGTVNVSVLLGS